MDVQLNLKRVEQIIVNKRIKCRDCDNYMTMGGVAFSVQYRGQYLGHTRIVCGCVDIPVKWIIDVKGKDEMHKNNATPAQ